MDNSTQIQRADYSKSIVSDALGPVAAYPSRLQMAFSGSIALIVIVFVFWITTVEYTRTIELQGWVASSSGIRRISAPRAGTITELLAKDGDQVQVSETIAIIGPAEFLETGRTLQDEVLTAKVRQYEAFQRVAATELERARLVLRRLRDQRATIEYEKQNVRELSSNVDARIDLLKRKLLRYRELADRGYSSANEIDATLEQILSAESESIRLERERRVLEARLEEVDVEERIAEHDLNAISQENEIRLVQLDQEKSELSLGAAASIKSPVSGQLWNLQVSTGTQVFAGQQIAHVLPEGDGLELVIPLPVTASGSVSEGHLMSIKWDAFPYQTFGTYSGTIVEIAKTAVLPSDLEYEPIAYSGPVFLARGNFEQDSGSPAEFEITLQPGMTFVAKVELDTRSMISWIFDARQ